MAKASRKKVARRFTAKDVRSWMREFKVNLNAEDENRLIEFALRSEDPRGYVVQVAARMQRAREGEQFVQKAIEQTEVTQAKPRTAKRPAKPEVKITEITIKIPVAVESDGYGSFSNPFRRINERQLSPDQGKALAAITTAMREGGVVIEQRYSQANRSMPVKSKEMAISKMLDLVYAAIRESQSES